MFCVNCGKEIASDARFCSYCGAPVKDVIVRSPAPEPQKEAFAENETLPPEQAVSENTVLTSEQTDPQNAVFEEQPNDVPRNTPLEEGTPLPMPNDIPTSGVGTSSSAELSAPANANIPNTPITPNSPNTENTNAAPAAFAATTAPAAPGAPAPEKPERRFTLGHIFICLAAVAVMAITAGVFAGLYFSVV